MMTADFHQRYSGSTVPSAMRFLADPHAGAREFWAGDPDRLREGDYPFTCGAALATIGSLLDVMGCPEHGPNVDQRSWLLDDDEAEGDEGDEGTPALAVSA